MSTRLAALVLFVLVACALASAAAARTPSPRTIYLVDRSETVTLAALENALPAFQAAVSEDLAPAWGADAKLVIAASPPADSWAVVLHDEAPAPLYVFGILGLHGNYHGAAHASVYAEDALAAGFAWQAVLTHELFELLVDPYLDRYVMSNRLWLVEVADPVEADAFNYARPAADGSLVPISDFVLPAWYRRHARGPYDHAGFVRRPLQLLHGGFAYYWQDGDWHGLGG